MKKRYVTFNRETGEVKITKTATANPDYTESGSMWTTPYDTTEEEREILINAIGSYCNGALHHGRFRDNENIISFKVHR